MKLLTNVVNLNLNRMLTTLLANSLPFTHPCFCAPDKCKSNINSLYSFAFQSLPTPEGSIRLFNG